MLTQKEKEFVEYWEIHREKEGRFVHQLLMGLPVGLCFGLPILVALIFRGWYKWMPYLHTEDLVVVMIAVSGIVLFYSIFRQRYLWDQKEQQYKELKAKK
jgi:hypothetical protein